MNSNQNFQIKFLKNSTFIYKGFETSVVQPNTLELVLKINTIESKYIGPEVATTGLGNLVKTDTKTDLITICQITTDECGNKVYNCHSNNIIENQGGVNPCAVNPCGVDPCYVNPCEVNPCGVNPCAVNPCGVDPCYVNPCEVNPCEVNPCGVDPCYQNNDNYINQQVSYEEQMYYYNLYITNIANNNPIYNYLLANPNNLSYPYTNNCNQYINPYTNQIIDLPTELINNYINSPYNKLYGCSDQYDKCGNKINNVDLSFITLELIFGGDISGVGLAKLDKSREFTEIIDFPIKIGPFGINIKKIRINYLYQICNGIPTWIIYGGEIDFASLLS
jgi:hypothetical protein